MSKIVLASALVLMVPLAAKVGAGAYHFIPFIPVAVLLQSQDRGTRPAGVGPLVTMLLVLAFAAQVAWIRVVQSDPARAAAQELRQMSGRHRPPLAVGYSAAYRTSFLRPILVLMKQPYLFDAPSIADRLLSGAQTAVFGSSPLAGCAIRTWFVHHGDVPFAVPNPYDPGTRLLDETFIESFQREYRLSERGRYFDAWVCRAN